MPFCSRRQHSFSRPQKQRTGEQHETANVKSQQKLSNCVRLFRNALKGGACGWSLDSGETQSSAIERPISTIFDKSDVALAYAGVLAVVVVVVLRRALGSSSGLRVCRQQ
ncbi:unnamed protein product [Sphagnum jensenii]